MHEGHAEDFGDVGEVGTPAVAETLAWRMKDEEWSEGVGIYVTY